MISEGTESDVDSVKTDVGSEGTDAISEGTESDVESKGTNGRESEGAGVETGSEGTGAGVGEDGISEGIGEDVGLAGIGEASLDRDGSSATVSASFGSSVLFAVGATCTCTRDVSTLWSGRGNRGSTRGMARLLKGWDGAKAGPVPPPERRLAAVKHSELPSM